MASNFLIRTDYQALFKIQINLINNLKRKNKILINRLNQTERDNKKLEAELRGNYDRRTSRI